MSEKRRDIAENMEMELNVDVDVPYVCTIPVDVYVCERLIVHKK